MTEQPGLPDAPKPWWLSRAVVGSVVTVAVGLAGIAGWSVDAAATTELVLSLLTMLSGALAWWGTVQRKAPIDQKQVLPGVRLPSAGVVHDEHEPALPSDPGPGRKTDGGYPSGPFFE